MLTLKRSGNMSELYLQSESFVPSGYGNSQITLLARDPYWLYAYWEISPESKDAFIRDLGPELWEKSVPALKVTNISKNESFFVRINDFSDSWYINVNYPNCLYVAELGRKISERFFISIASSNYVSTPGCSVSSNTAAYFINYNDLKNGLAGINTLNGINISMLKTCQAFNLNFKLSDMAGSSSDVLTK